MLSTLSNIYSVTANTLSDYLSNEYSEPFEELVEVTEEIKYTDAALIKEQGEDQDMLPLKILEENPLSVIQAVLEESEVVKENSEKKIDKKFTNLTEEVFTALLEHIEEQSKLNKGLSSITENETKVEVQFNFIKNQIVDTSDTAGLKAFKVKTSNLMVEIKEMKNNDQITESFFEKLSNLIKDLLKTIEDKLGSLLKKCHFEIARILV